eukprot:CAMPEP_0178666546 /NCGR_PEP_ID=MMETSP0698-20121128/30549_1 /TAXON_ID=265572 /ORGANISM="Extubocellulus spinifer, Strain CCMP396" /LENGTH=506 /DNA_ID=CAMNT_0020309943 /DNA_START=59 /DNA_END=1576 /DNA_ORIENTATION=-
MAYPGRMRLLFVLPTVAASSSMLGFLGSDERQRRQLDDDNDRHICFDNRCHDDSEYQSPFGTTCTDHLGLLSPTRTCFNEWRDTGGRIKISEHASVEAGDSILMDLMASCPCACNMDCGDTSAPTPRTTEQPTLAPTANPSAGPTQSPSEVPTFPPTLSPTANPSATPTPSPTTTPTFFPTVSPTSNPSAAPTPNPSEAPYAGPTPSPSEAPTFFPTLSPTANPSVAPTPSPSAGPTVAASPRPSGEQTPSPSVVPSANVVMFQPRDAVSQLEEQTGIPPNEDGEQWWKPFMDLSTRTIILISVFSVIAIGAIAYSGILIRRYVITEDPPVPPPAPPRHYPSENLTSVSLSGLSGRKLHHDRHRQWSSRHSVDYAPSQISAPVRRDHTPYRPRRVRSRSVDFDERNRSIESYNVRNRGSFTSAEDGERYSYASYTDDELDDIVDEFLDFSGWQEGRDSRRPRDGDSKKVHFSRARQVNLIHDIASAANEVSDAGQLIGKKVQNMAG